MPFKKDDLVAWSHTLPSIYGQNSVLKESAVRALDPNAVIGMVVKNENDKGTLVRVVLEGKKTHAHTTIKPDKDNSLVLTSEELIRIEEDEKEK